MAKSNLKKEFVMNLPPVAYRKILKDEFCRMFCQDMKTVYDALEANAAKRVKVPGTENKTEARGHMNAEDRLKWFWTRFNNLMAAKYRIELLPSNDDLYFLVRRITEAEIEKHPSKWAERLELVKRFFNPQMSAV